MNHKKENIISNFNPYHDELGRFTTADRAVSPELPTTPASTVYDLIVTSAVALPAGGRLDRALQASNLDIETMLALAFVESTFQQSAKAKTSSAVGYFQITKTAARDILYRIWPRFVDAPLPFRPINEEHTWREDPKQNTTAAYVYLLDRIAAGGNSLERGLEMYYGSSSHEANNSYAQKVLRCKTALKKLHLEERSLRETLQKDYKKVIDILEAAKKN